MSGDDWRSFSRGPKKPAPEHGIKMKKAGTTWWGQRWIEALELVLRGDAGRLARGRTYARAGRTHDFEVRGGKVTAKVTGSRTTPYEIALELSQHADAIWEKAVQGMASQAEFSSELLAGQMPKRIDEVFRAAEASLFPTQRNELVTSCSCPDWGDPCKHVAAAHYVLGEALDRDPFLLFELRGRSKAQVLDALRAARGGAPVPADASQAWLDAQLEVPKVAFGNVDARDYDRAREELPALQFSFDAPVTHAAVLLQLGAPGAWGGDGTPAQALSPLIRDAAEAARRIALAEPESPTLPEQDPPRSSEPRANVPVSKARASKSKSKAKKRARKRSRARR